MIAYGTNDDGKREILGFPAYRNESRETWKDFLTGLKKRGLCGLMMITSDAHDDIINAARERCFRTFHGSDASSIFQRTSLPKLRRKSRLVSVLNYRKCSTVK